MRIQLPARAAFTLLELLVVVATIGILLALLVPVLAKARDSAESVVCGTRLHNNGLAVALYGEENKQAYPDFNYTWTPGNSGITIIQYVPKKAATTGWDYFSPACMVCPGDEAPGQIRVLDDKTGEVKAMDCSYDVNVDFLMREYRQDQVKGASELVFMFEGTPGSAAKQGAYMGTEHWAASALGDAHFGRMGNVLWADGHVTSEDQLPLTAYLMSGTQAVSGPGGGTGGGSSDTAGTGGTGGAGGSGGGGNGGGNGNGGGGGNGRH